ncbi:MAG: HAMP domain-containing histidine kinase [Raineya sp.]|jgi:signal transduction histidine kinase|nr:HAMP domain-containing histidine kinase [Raineya sp.]
MDFEQNVYQKDNFFFDTIVNAFPEPIVIDSIGENGNLTTLYYNKKYVETIGTSSIEVRTQKQMFIENMTKNKLFNTLSSATKEQETKFIVRCKDSINRIYRVVFNLYNQKILVTVLNEITDVEKYRELERMNTIKDRLLSILSHDSRMPLNSLHALLDMLRNNDINFEDFNNFLPEVEQQVDKVITFLDNLTSWIQMQIKKGEVLIAPQMVSVDEVIQEIKPLFQSSIIAKKINFEYVPTDIQVYVDYNMFSLIIRNLISNAIKFAKTQGNVSIHVETDSFIVHIIIEDNGIGLTKEEINKILSTQMISHQGTNHEIGFGLGLTLVQEYIKLNKGSLNILSVPNQGSKFIVSFPI